MFVVAIAASFGAACAHPTTTERALSFVAQHREAEAVAILRAHLVKKPGDVDARRLLTRVLASTGDLPAARAEVEKLKAQLPKADPAPWIELGHAFELTHRFEDALDAYDEAARIAPHSPDGPREGGMRAAHWGEAEEARPRLEEAIRRGARDASTYHALGLVCVHLKEYAAAESAYRAGAAVDPSDASNWLGLATVAVVRGDATRALIAYDAVLARRPKYAAAELGRAWALVKLGRLADAERALNHAAELGASAREIIALRGGLASASGAIAPE